MKKLVKKSKKHLKEVSESYLEHGKFAAGFSIECFKAGTMALIHACCPALFEHDASKCVKKLNQKIQKTRGRSR